MDFEPEERDRYDCPAPDCDYSSASLEAVKGHWGGKQDGDHQGRWHEAYAAAEEARGESTEDAHEEPAGESSEQAPVGQGDSEPTADAPTDPPEPEGQLTCPECGGDRWFDPREHGVQYDRGCADCSDGENWVVWNV